MRNHVARHGVASRWADAAELIETYMSAHWTDPCHDWWEEREGVHAVTVGSLWAGVGGDALADAARATSSAERLDGSHAFLVVLGLADAALDNPALIDLSADTHSDRAGEGEPAPPQDSEGASGAQ